MQDLRSFLQYSLRPGARAPKRPFSGGSPRWTLGRSCWTSHIPPLRTVLSHTQTLIGKIKIEPAGMLGDAGTDRPLGTIKLRAGFEQIER